MVDALGLVLVLSLALAGAVFVRAGLRPFLVLYGVLAAVVLAVAGIVHARNERRRDAEHDQLIAEHLEARQENKAARTPAERRALQRIYDYQQQKGTDNAPF